MSRVLKKGKNRITQGFTAAHKAVDLGREHADGEPVIAHTAGKVVFCQTGRKNEKGSVGNASYGNCVRIDHADGYATLYAHLASVSVKLGEEVSQGQVIGTMGDSGNAYGIHLHFEVRKDNERINPIPYLDADLPIETEPDVVYAAHYKGGAWLSDVKNHNDKNADGYAGILGKAIDGIRARLTRGSVVYRVHTVGGKYLAWVRDHEKAQGGYAGLYGKNIDGVQMYLEGVSGCAVEYRVAPVGKGYLPWVRNFKENDPNGYAGIYGKPIDRIQIRIVKV